MSQSPKEIWEEKLEHLRKEEAIAGDPNLKFTIKKQIEEAKIKIAELSSYTGLEVGNIVNGITKVELSRLELVLHHADHQADQELWSNVQLKLFSKIEPRVRLLESPFHGELDHNSLEESEDITEANKFIYKFQEFVCNYFWCDWGALGWQEQLQSCREDLKSLPIVFLTGDAGIGKTASLKLMASKWREQEYGKIILPIYAPLTDIFEASRKHGEVFDFDEMLDRKSTRLNSSH